MPDLDLADQFPPYSRIRGHRGGGTVEDIGTLRGQPVVYVAWDRSSLDQPLSKEAVVPSQLLPEA
ncbi:hypothetical protein [Microtetraspora glauca]|uniref:Uncharacterized protein n=1 Tax=Microtetraspora glauca TaxID=1996 RepID=A0ABV3GA31_MICGL